MVELMNYFNPVTKNKISKIQIVLVGSVVKYQEVLSDGLIPDDEIDAENAHKLIQNGVPVIVFVTDSFSHEKQNYRFYGESVRLS